MLLHKPEPSRHPPSDLSKDPHHLLPRSVRHQQAILHLLCLLPWTADARDPWQTREKGGEGSYVSQMLKPRARKTGHFREETAELQATRMLSK
ncbi:hypothetical protein AAY473_014334 [Plecturocebus cupreus]